ncbi:MAG: hypothetical protein V1735_01295 [Nanoarchaeota archaeon]
MGTLKPSEALILEKLKEPHDLQAYVDGLTYHIGPRLCPVAVLRSNQGDCFEAAIFACAVMRQHKVPCFLVDLRAVQDEDHVLAVFKVNGRFGAIAKSKYLGLKYRNPVFFTVQELVMSYFEHFFNYRRELTLRAYSEPFHLSAFGDLWLLKKAQLNAIEKRLDTMKHHRILSNKARLPRVDPVRFHKEALLAKDGKPFKGKA